MHKIGVSTIKRLIVIAILTFLIIIPIAFIMKMIARNQTIVALDDVSPLIPCQQDLIDKADILFVIPFYEHSNLSDYPEWCAKMRATNKEFGLHGFYHNVFEMKDTQSQELYQAAIKEFEECFGKKPTTFRPPMWKINDENVKILKQDNLELMADPLKTSTYHCNGRGMVFSIIGLSE